MYQPDDVYADFYRPEDARFFEAILCTILAQTDGPVTFSARDITDYGNRYRFRIQPDRENETVTMGVVDQDPPPVPAARKRPRRQRFGRNGS